MQCSMQEVSNMIKNKLKIIVFLINNQCSGSEVVQGKHKSHKKLENWNYCGLVEALNPTSQSQPHGSKTGSKTGSNTDDHVITMKVNTGIALKEAIEVAKHHSTVSFIECVFNGGDLSIESHLFKQQFHKCCGM